MPAPFFSYGGARQNSGFVFLSMLRIIIIRVCVSKTLPRLDSLSQERGKGANYNLPVIIISVFLVHHKL